MQPGFRLFGIPMRIGGDALVISLIIIGDAYLRTRDPTPILLFAAAVIPVVVVHELGHAIESRRAGGTPVITIGILGGQTAGMPPVASHWRRAWVALAGIAYSLAFLVFVYSIMVISGLSSDDTTLAGWLWLLVLINGWWALIQLLPFGVFDGSAILEHGLAGLGVRSATRIVLVINVIFGVAVTAWLFSINQVFLALYAAYISWLGVAQRTTRQRR